MIVFIITVSLNTLEFSIHKFCSPTIIFLPILYYSSVFTYNVTTTISISFMHLKIWHRLWFIFLHYSLIKCQILVILLLSWLSHASTSSFQLLLPWLCLLWPLPLTNTIEASSLVFSSFAKSLVHRCQFITWRFKLLCLNTLQKKDLDPHVLSSASMN